MKKITESQLKTSTNMLREYMRVIEATQTQAQIAANLAPPGRINIAPTSSQPNAATPPFMQQLNSVPTKLIQMNPPKYNSSVAPTSMGDWTEPGYSGPVTPQTFTPTSMGDWTEPGYSGPVTPQTFTHDPASNLDGSTPSSQPVPSTTPTAPQLAPQTGAKKPTKTPAKSKSTAKSNPMVKDLQQKLNSMGANLKVDGVMGPNTQAAMKKYQYVTPGSQQGQMLGSQTAGMNQPAATTPATQPTPRVSGADQARGAFATESVRYGEDPTLARIVGLAGL